MTDKPTANFAAPLICDSCGKTIEAKPGETYMGSTNGRVWHYGCRQSARSSTPREPDAEWLREDMRNTIQIVEFRLALRRITERYPPDTVAGRLAADVLAKYPNQFENADRENDDEPFAIPEIEGLPLGPLTRLQAKAPETGWQPIETAPKDGGPDILVYVEETGEQFVAYYDREMWVYALRSGGGQTCCEATHWRPLPEPPNPPYSGIVVVNEADFTRGEE